MMRSNGISRRRFLASTALAAAGPMIVRPHILGAATESLPPSERLNLALIGPGKQGLFHLNGLCRRSDVNIVAVAEVQEERRQLCAEKIEKLVAEAKAKAEKDQAKPDPKTSTASDPTATQQPSAASMKGPPATSPKDIKYYNDFREVLARGDVDAVLIATPDHWHAVQVIAAVRAGKDVYCEKPLTLTIGEGRAIVEEVRRHNRILQVGSQQRSSWEFRFACEMLRSGRIGDLKSINITIGGPSWDCYLPEEPIRAGVDWDMWVGPAPFRPFHSELCPPRSQDIFPHWRSYRDFSGGGMTDWGAHHFDIAQWGMGMDESGPVEIIPPDGKDVKFLTYRYASGVEMYHGGGGPGVKFNGTRGVIEVSRGVLRTDPTYLAQTPTRPSEVHLYKSPGHHEDFIRCVRNRQQPICTAEIGHRSATICHLGNLAYWLNRPLKWDPAKEQFVGDEEANRWVDRPKRAPWTL